MLTTSAAKFCVEIWSAFSNISLDDPKTTGKPLNVVSWPECRPELPSDGDDGGDVQSTLAIWQDPKSITYRNRIYRAANPSLRPENLEILENKPF